MESGQSELELLARWGSIQPANLSNRSAIASTVYADGDWLCKPAHEQWERFLANLNRPLSLKVYDGLAHLKISKVDSAILADYRLKHSLAYRL